MSPPPPPPPPPPPGTVLPFSPKQHSHLTPYLAALHASCIVHDRTMATFLPPLSHEKLLAWWKERIAEVVDGKRLIWMLVAKPDAEADASAGAAGTRTGTRTGTEPAATTGRKLKGTEITGVVMLCVPHSETGAFRGRVEKLLVHKSFRGRGGARALMGALEAEALSMGRTLLVLDAESDSPAEAVCKKLGYIESGRVPAYGMSPTGDRRDVTFFYKQLGER
ncbi:hypothetical protein E4U41_002501 [Claviceps citrina]|nr:hypothetical protein E4U41_002501 [Claviceps citrina]